MNYNPADYAAIENKAKAMSKTELELLYVKEKDERYMPVCAIIFLILLGVVGLFMIGGMGYVLALDNFNEKINEVSNQISDEVCPIVSNAYIEIDLKSTEYNIKVDCLEYRQR